MEFLLGLPIYFALLGGVFQVGELLLARTNVFMSDRVAVAAAGSRYDSNYNSMWSYLNSYLLGSKSGNSVSAIQFYEHLHHPNYSWSGTLGGRTSLRIPTPQWTASWLNYSDKILPKMNNSLPVVYGDSIVVARLPQNKQEYNYVTLMRTKKGESGYRALRPAGLCYEELPVINSMWYDYVYQENFAFHDFFSRSGQDGFKSVSSPEGQKRASIVADANDHKEYMRFPTYVLWGQ